MDWNMRLSKQSCDRIIRDNTEFRVAEGAAIKLSDVLSAIGDKIAERADKFVDHSDKVTIRAKDIEYAIQDICGKPKNGVDDYSDIIKKLVE